MLDFAECERLVSRARDKRSKPVQNNTRVEKRDEDTYALRLHATDIATFHRDGRITVNSGGYRTVTTAERLDGWVFDRTRARHSDHGIWYVKSEPDANDPEPPRGDRSVLKPFEALDPGPEPVKPTEGCLAGTEVREKQREKTHVWRRELRDDDEVVDSSGGELLYVERDVTTVRRYIEERYSYWASQNRADDPDADRTVYKQCPHCKLFDSQHDAWGEAMNGGGWGRNRTHGYAKMVELLERYGSRAAWQDAYITDFRAAREAKKLHRAWVDRNRVTFEDGMEITAEGYAKRPDPKQIAREQRKVKSIERKKARINKFVANAVKELAEVGIPMPSGGDCWYCSMSQDGGRNPMGDSMPTLHEDGQVTNEVAVDHLWSHVEENYYVPSMFVNALRERGYQDAGIYMFLGMNPDEDRMGGPGSRVSTDSVTRDLRSYLFKRLLVDSPAVVLR